MGRTVRWIGLGSLILGGFYFPQRRGYLEGDWVSISDFRFVTSLAVGTQHIYVGTNNGVERFHRFSGRWDPPLTVSDGLPSGRVNALGVDPVDHAVWIGTTGGLARYLEGVGEWQVFTTQDGLPHQDIRDLFFGAGEYEGFLYVQAGGQWTRFRYPLQRWDSISPQLLPPTRARVTSQKITPELLSDPRFFFLTPGFMTGENLRTFLYTVLVRDLMGDYYVGTWGANLSRYSPIHGQWEHLPFGLIEEQVGAMARDPLTGTYWFGGRPINLRLSGGPSAGVTAADFDLQRWRYYEPGLVRELNSAATTQIVVEPEVVWLATDQGLVRLHKKNGEWVTYTSRQGLSDDGVTALLPLGDELWVGTSRGLVLWRPREARAERPKELPFGPIRVTALAGDSGQVWVGTNQGLYRLSRSTGHWTMGGTGRGGLAGGRVVELRWREGQLWVASDRGLEILTPSTGKWSRFLIGESFLTTPITALEVDQANVWLGSRDGVFRYDREQELWTLYTEEDGLLATPVYDIMSDGDYVWFATPRGATRFYWNNPFRAR